jgi:hypothetical protein
MISFEEELLKAAAFGKIEDVKLILSVEGVSVNWSDPRLFASSIAIVNLMKSIMIH